MMKERRQFLKAALATFAGAGFLLGPFFSLIRPLRAAERKVILPKGTKREGLANRNPADLDTRNLDLTPLKDFQTMGPTDYKVDVEKWRLAVSGQVKKPFALTYPQIQALPPIEKRVLLICPGFFANFGLWKGIQVEELLAMAEAEKSPAYVTFHSEEQTFTRTQRFSRDEILAGKVFLAYGVNGERLPQKHGFPLRVVAEGHYGNTWIKYVSRVVVE
jgi:DMSO/TMAO reductase YedYZ molybdopterin-dependent catalytic subunit